MVAQDAPDLSARQLAVLLTVHLDPAPHTVRGLAAKLRISKPAVTRALDRLEHLTLAQRTIDAMDRRSVLISLRSGASTFLENLRSGALAAGDAQ
jgi:DNA-binding MarR family transcriptional regulator